jgi:hypothetical protein
MRHAMLILAGLTAAPALADKPPIRPEEVRIPFVQFGAIRTFRTAGEDVIYLQDRRRNWYRAELNGPCPGIERALRIGVDSRYSATLDNSSTLLVDGQRCPIQSLVRSAEPPRRPRN